MSRILNFQQALPAPDTGYQNTKWQATTTPNGVDPTTGLPYFDTSTEVPSTGGVAAKTSSYTAAAADCGKLLTFNSASASTLTLPATPPSVGTNQWTVGVQNIGTGLLTLAVTTPATINSSSASIPILTGMGLLLYTDGTNYFAEEGRVPIATVAAVGVVKPDGTSITITTDGTISAVVINFADNEVVGGSGTAGTLAHAPSPTGSLQLFRYLTGFGLIGMLQGTDYTLSGTNITPTNSFSTGELHAWYRY